MKKEFRLLFFLLTAVMIFSMFPMTVAFYAHAENENTAGDAVFIWPLEDLTARVDSPFGFRRSAGRTHMGIDVVLPVGSPVIAAASGTVRTSTREGAWGNLIIIDHDYPFERLSTFYAHLHTREPGITPGTRVNPGQLIGTVGRTGNAAVPHLHFELRFNNMPVNPMTFFHSNETRAANNPNPLFISHEGRWVFNPTFDHTFTVHEYSVHRQRGGSFLLPLYDGDAFSVDPSLIPTLPDEVEPAIVFDPNDLGFIPQALEIVDSFAFGASAWSAPEIDEAIHLGIIPENLLSDFQNEITRSEFAEAAVRAILVLSGAIADTNEDEFAEYVSMLIHEYDPFDDTDNVFVIIAHYLQIVTGVGDRVFAPDNSITRQEAATMLSRVGVAFDVTEAGDAHVSFADSGMFAPWASDAIEFVASNGIMVGTGDDLFSPTGPYTREQTFVTLVRLAGVVG